MLTISGCSGWASSIFSTESPPPFSSVVSVVSAGAFEALGKGIQSFLISFLRYVVVIIPAAFVLSKTVGVHGVWHAFWIAEIITAVIAFILYYQLIGKSGKND